jgi:AcrR family transcriptional regulator
MLSVVIPIDEEKNEMNAPKTKSRKPRPRAYHSPLREDQVEQTRLRILQAMAEHLAEDGAESITLPSVARRAGMSAPTVYRYFATREALVEAFWDWLGPRWGLPKGPVTLEELESSARSLMRFFDGEQALAKAFIYTPEGRRVRRQRQAERNQMAIGPVAELVAGLSPAAQRRAFAAVKMFIGIPVWLEMHENWGLEGEEIGNIAAWALKALVNEIKRNPKGLEGE